MGAVVGRGTIRTADDLQPRRRVMRSISFRAVLIVAAVGFFALGVVSTLMGPSGAPVLDRPSPTGARSPTTAALSAPQITVLVLGVDSVQAERPELLAVWLVSFRPPGKEVFLFGFPLDHPLASGATLAGAFSWSGGPGAEFLSSLTSLAPLPLDAVIALDAEGFAALIDFLGGVPTGEANVDGAAALNILDLLRSDPAASLLAQARLLEALAARVGAVQPGTDLQPLLALVPDHAYVSLPPEAGLTLIAPYLPLGPNRIHLSLPTSGEAEG